MNIIHFCSTLPLISLSFCPVLSHVWTNAASLLPEAGASLCVQLAQSLPERRGASSFPLPSRRLSEDQAAGSGTIKKVW